MDITSDVRCARFWRLRTVFVLLGVLSVISSCEESVSSRNGQSKFVFVEDSVLFVYYQDSIGDSNTREDVWATIDIFRNSHLSRVRIPASSDGDSVTVKFPLPRTAIGITVQIAPQGVQIPIDAVIAHVMVDDLMDIDCHSRGWGSHRVVESSSIRGQWSKCSPAAIRDVVVAELASRESLSLARLQTVIVDLVRLGGLDANRFWRAHAVTAMYNEQFSGFHGEAALIHALHRCVDSTEPLSYVEQQVLSLCIGRQLALLGGGGGDGQGYGDEALVQLFELSTDVNHVYLANAILNHVPGLTQESQYAGLNNEAYAQFCRFWVEVFRENREVYHAFSPGVLNLLAMLALGSGETDLVDDIDAVRLKYLESSRRVVSRHPGDVVPFYVIDDLQVDLATLMAELYEKRGDTETSIRFLEEALAESSGSSLMMRASAHLNLVDRYMEIGKKRDATRHYSLAVDMIESNPTLQSLIDSIGQVWGLRVDSAFATESSISRVFSPFVVRSRAGTSVRFPVETDQSTLLLFTSSGCAPCVRDFPDLWHYLEQVGLSSSTFLIVRRDDHYRPEQVPPEQILDFSSDFYSIGLFDALPEVFVLHGDTTVANANTFKVEEVKAVLGRAGDL